MPRYPIDLQQPLEKASLVLISPYSCSFRFLLFCLSTLFPDPSPRFFCGFKKKGGGWRPAGAATARLRSLNPPLLFSGAVGALTAAAVGAAGVQGCQKLVATVAQLGVHQRQTVAEAGATVVAAEGFAADAQRRRPLSPATPGFVRSDALPSELPAGVTRPYAAGAHPGLSTSICRP